MVFEDVVKEGDGQRIYEFYKFFLLIYKFYKYIKYVYVILYYFVRILVILFEFEVDRFKWNRVVNLYGGKVCNVLMDLRKEY